MSVKGVMGTASVSYNRLHIDEDLNALLCCLCVFLRFIRRILASPLSPRQGVSP
jgi:hypothetical protein